MAHRSRDLQLTDTLASVRALQFILESFCIKNGRLYCQCCRKYIKTKMSQCKRHCGQDEKQNGSNKGTNNGAKHKANLELWKNGGAAPVVVDFTDIVVSFVELCLTGGVNLSQCARFKRFFDEYQIENTGSFPGSRQGVFLQSSWCRLTWQFRASLLSSNLVF